jgi:hypothetical protein
MIVIKNFLSSDDVSTVYEYAKSSSFHTKDNHPTLHDNLYSQDSISFDLRTRGEFSDEILQIFSKYSKGFYDIVTEMNKELDYLPPMFSKHYIARYVPGAGEFPHTDTNRPEHTLVSYIVWNADYSGGKITSVNMEARQEKEIEYSPGDLIIFEEGNLEDMRKITPVIDGNLYLSQAWMGLKGQSWFPNVDYDKVEWDNWEIRGF